MKKNKLIIIIIIIVVSLIITFIFSQFFKQKKTVTNSTPSISVLKNTLETNYQLPTFNGIWPNLPQELPLLKFVLTNNALIKEKLNDYCQTESASGNFYYGKICTYYYYNSNQNLEIVSNVHSDSENLPLLTLNEANQKAQNFLNTFITDTQSLTQTNVAYLAGGDEVFIVSPEKAIFIQLNYNYTYQDIPILEKNDNNDSFSIIISQDLPLKKAEISTKNLTFTPQDQLFKLISLDQALNNISHGEAYLTNIGDFSINENRPQLDLSSLKEIEFSQVKLEYRYESNQLLVAPYYRFFGTGIDNNKNSFNLEIFTPAIKIS